MGSRWILTVCVKSSRFVVAIFSHGRLRVRDTCEWSGDAIQIQIPGRLGSQSVSGSVFVSVSYKKACSSHTHADILLSEKQRRERARVAQPARQSFAHKRSVRFLFVLFLAFAAAGDCIGIATSLAITHTHTQSASPSHGVCVWVCVPGLFVVFRPS